MSKERIVIKIGTGVLTTPSGNALDALAMLKISAAVVDLCERGIEVILVSSGAVGTALGEFSITERPNDIADLQSLAAVGQARLMHAYHNHFSPHGFHVGQMLLSYADLESPDREARILRTLENLLAREKIIPIINENDSVAVEELRFGDNDALSSKIAVACKASTLVLLTTEDGLLANKSTNTCSVVSEVVNAEEAKQHVIAEKGAFSVGGMASKLDAADFASRNGIVCFIANGKDADKLWDKVYGDDKTRTRIATR